MSNVVSPHASSPFSDVSIAITRRHSPHEMGRFEPAVICPRQRQVAQSFIKIPVAAGYSLIGRTFSARICATVAILVSGKAFRAHNSRQARQFGRLEEFASGLRHRRFQVR
jgi:hypothetical protein